MTWQTIQLRQPTFAEVFATISGHFLTQELPKNWEDFEEEYLEEWFTECALDTYEYWDWRSVYDEINGITETVMKLYEGKT